MPWVERKGLHADRGQKEERGKILKVLIKTSARAIMKCDMSKKLQRCLKVFGNFKKNARAFTRVEKK
jgi:hypothetical protein